MVRNDLPPGILAQARLTPWKVQNEIYRYLSLPRARLLFAWAGIPWGAGWRLYGVPIIQRHRTSILRIGDRMELRSSVRSNPLGPNHPVILSTRRAGAQLAIGVGFSMTGGTISADESITIGDRVMIGANCTIIDTDFHPLNPQRRAIDVTAGATRPVMIEDDVFIGMGCLILKGARIGAGAVIGAGSVVSGTIPPGMIAAGNPARPLRPVPTNGGGHDDVQLVQT